MLRALMGRFRRFVAGLIGEAVPQPVPVARPTHTSRT